MSEHKVSISSSMVGMDRASMPVHKENSAGVCGGAEASGFQGVAHGLALSVEKLWQILLGKVGKRGDNIGVPCDKMLIEIGETKGQLHIVDVADKDKEFNGRVKWTR